jgi:hypothetical protein
MPVSNDSWRQGGGCRRQSNDRGQTTDFGLWISECGIKKGSRLRAQGPRLKEINSSFLRSAVNRNKE